LNSRGVGWDVDLNVHRRISARLGTSIEVITETLPGAQLAEHSVDVVLCVSSLEHFSEPDVADTAREIPRILKPDGICVFTVDCFLDLAPFTNATQNKWGRNASIFEFLKQAGLALKAGKEDELLGFPSFKPASVLNRLPEYHVGRGYPCLAQCFVASPAPVGSYWGSKDSGRERVASSLLAAPGV
jgi:SAM-dependent methyltransferase